jgi:hypothetical protein
MVLFQKLFLSCSLAAGVDEVNFGGGGGGGLARGGGGGIPLDDDGWTNIFGAGIVEIFLTPKSACSDLPDLDNSDPCNELEKK